MKKPKYDINRGRHKKHASQETRDWNAKHVHLPKTPPWMDEETAARLTELRRQINPWETPQ